MSEADEQPEELDAEERFGGRRIFRPRGGRKNPIQKVRHARPPVGAGDLEPAEIDINVAHAARVYDYLLGGTANFAVDRETAHYAFASYPGGFEGVQLDAQANRAFLGRAVRWLVTEAGIRQFLDIGAGIPAEGNVHEVAQQHASDARIVYVDNDPIVLAHAHELLDSSDTGLCAYVDGDFQDPEPILKDAADLLDFDQPIAVMLVGLLHVIPDHLDPHGAIRKLLEPMTSGSYLAISQLTVDDAPDDMATVQQRLEEKMGTWNPPALRSQAEVTAFFDGLELVGDGVVRGDLWRADGPPNGPRLASFHAGVARKP